MLRPLVFASLCALAGCVPEPASLGGTPLFAACDVPIPTSESAPITSCSSASLGDVSRIYPTPEEDRLESCRSRFPELTQVAEWQCPRGELTLLFLRGEVLVLEAQGGTWSNGVFVHTFTPTVVAGPPFVRYTGTKFIASELAAKIGASDIGDSGAIHANIPVTATPLSATFIVDNHIVVFDGETFKELGAFESRFEGIPLVAQAAVPAPDGTTIDGYVISDFGDRGVRRLENDGTTRFTWEEERRPNSPQTSFYALATSLVGEIAALGSAGTEQLTTLTVLESTGAHRYTIRLPSLRGDATLRFDGGEIFVIGTTNVRFSQGLSGEPKIDETWDHEHTFAGRFDARTGCPQSLYDDTRLSSVEVSARYRPLIDVPYGMYAFGFDNGTRETSPQLVLSDRNGRYCGSVELVDDGTASPLSQIVDLNGHFGVTDGTDVWFVQGR